MHKRFANPIHIFGCFILFICLNSFSQSVQLLTSGTKTSIRGLSAVSDKVIWASGSQGMIARSIDSGKTWNWNVVTGFEKTEFRDIEAFDENTAVIMGITEPAVILRTTNGGSNWHVVFEDSSKSVFLDAMEFWNDQSGIVLGDPISGRFFILRTFDNGITWQRLPQANLPVADSGEACFASSGTNIRALTKQEAVFVSGGKNSNLFIRDKKIRVPLLQGKESTGANSIAVKNKKFMIVVGGDFMQKELSDGNCAITKDGGKSWLVPHTSPNGYRSCIEFIRKKSWVTCGLTGVDLSKDDGMNFTLVSNESFHVCRKAKKGNSVFLAGGGGRIAKLIL